MLPSSLNSLPVPPKDEPSAGFGLNVAHPFTHFSFILCVVNSQLLCDVLIGFSLVLSTFP